MGVKGIHICDKKGIKVLFDMEKVSKLYFYPVSFNQWEIHFMFVARNAIPLNTRILILIVNIDISLFFSNKTTLSDTALNINIDN